MSDKVELLAPAGDWEAFLAAVENGADAVYLGGKLFNARQFAGNFDEEQLKKAIFYAHVRNVKVYLTMNTLISDSEMKEALECVENAYLSGIDGIIVQDLGFAGLIKRVYPDLDLHASTQMTAYNLEGVRMLEQLGFKRVVLARELSVNEIEQISRNTDVEIEIFIHGALCVCYSGQCLMSSIIGGRSGNRGKCAQPCRLPYGLVKSGCKGEGERLSVDADSRFFLSPKDLCSVDILGQVIGTGVKSLKIEGRMKSPEYVAIVVGTYRKYIDRYFNEKTGSGCNIAVAPSDTKKLAQIFNRGGFSKGYFHGKSGRDMMCFEKPKNWGIYLGQTVSYDSSKGIVGIRLEEDLAIGDGIEIWSGQDENPGTVVSEIKLDGKNVQAALKGRVVSVGRIKGRVPKGVKVYKTSDKQLNLLARETFSGKAGRKSELQGRISIKRGTPVKLVAFDDRGNEVEAVSGSSPEQAINKPLAHDKVMEQMRKTGSTPFEFSSIEIELEENLSVPISVLNEIRRSALEEMELKRGGIYCRAVSDEQRKNSQALLHFPGNSRNRSENLKISLLLYQWNEKFDYSCLGVERIYFPFNMFLDKKNTGGIPAFRQKGIEVFAWLPPITRGNYDDIIKSRLGKISDEFLDGIMIGNLGSIGAAMDFPNLKVVGDNSLNAFNSFSLKELSLLGLKGTALSLELTLSQIKDMRRSDGFSTEIVAYGRIPLMTSEYCPAGSLVGGFSSSSECSGVCHKGSYKLKDRMGVEFPVVCDRIDCRSTIFNSNVLFIPESLDRARDAGVETIRLNITDESEERIRELVSLYRYIADNGTSRIERYKNLVDGIKSQGFTKGHYFRGV